MEHVAHGQRHRTNSARRGADEALSGRELHSTPPTPPKKEKKNLGFLSPRKLDETRDSFHSFYFSLAATKGL